MTDAFDETLLDNFSDDEDDVQVSKPAVKMSKPLTIESPPAPVESTDISVEELQSLLKSIDETIEPVPHVHIPQDTTEPDVSKVNTSPFADLEFDEEDKRVLDVIIREQKSSDDILPTSPQQKVFNFHILTRLAIQLVPRCKNGYRRN
jgi:hypothetical protein